MPTISSLDSVSCSEPYTERYRNSAHRRIVPGRKAAMTSPGRLLARRDRCHSFDQGGLFSRSDHEELRLVRMALKFVVRGGRLSEEPMRQMRRMVVGLPVVRPESMPIAEITPYKPTSQY